MGQGVDFDLYYDLGIHDHSDRFLHPVGLFVQKVVEGVVHGLLTHGVNGKAWMWPVRVGVRVGVR